MSDVPLADCIPFSAAARLCPGSPSASTVWRWATRGISTPAGRLRLRSVGAGKMFTTIIWLREFLEAAATRRHSEPAVVEEPIKPPTSTQRARRIADAKRELAAS